MPRTYRGGNVLVDASYLRSTSTASVFAISKCGWGNPMWFWCESEIFGRRSVQLYVLWNSWYLPQVIISDNIDERCRALNRIDVRTTCTRGNNEMINPLLSNLLSSSGHQVKQTRVYDMTGIQLQTVFTACPYVRLDWGVENSCLLIALGVVGEHLENAILVKSIHNQPVGETGLSWKSCSNLREVSFLPEAKIWDIQAFFAQTKPSVKKSSFLACAAM